MSVFRKGDKVRFEGVVVQSQESGAGGVTLVQQGTSTGIWFNNHTLELVERAPPIKVGDQVSFRTGTTIPYKVIAIHRDWAWLSTELGTPYSALISELVPA